MKLHVLSDLHNEFLRGGKHDPSHPWTGGIPATDADIIILAGDIDTGLNGVQWMIEESGRLQKPIIYVLGNHEFYRHEYGSLKSEIRTACRGTDVTLLDCDTWEYKGDRFIGATLWTDYKTDKAMPQDLAMFYAGKNLVDHRLIKYKTSTGFQAFKPIHALAIHEQEKTWLVEQLEEPFDGKTVVVTHHGPHPRCNHPDLPNSPLTPAFCSDLESIIASYDIDLWVYGHVHANVDTVVAGTRIISNQAGYPGEKVLGFDPEMLIEL